MNTRIRKAAAKKYPNSRRLTEILSAKTTAPVASTLTICDLM